MMWPFTRKPKATKPVLNVKSAGDLIDYNCEYMTTKLQPGYPLAAEVLDAATMFGTSVAVKVDERGIQTATLRVASDDGGFTVIATTQNSGDLLEVGDAVAWVPGVFMQKLADASPDRRTGWVGLIVAKIAPEIDMNMDAMTILHDYGVSR